MSIIRTKKSKNFTTINNTCLKDPALSARAKGIFAYIMTLPDDWKIYKSEIHKHFKEGKNAIHTAFKELEESGYIKKEANHTGGRLEGWNYFIYETPQPIQDSDSQDSEYPKSSDTENRPLLNTNLNQKTKELNKNIKKTFKTWSEEELKQSILRNCKKPEHTNDMLIAFFNYWSEKTPNGKKMLFQTKPSWETTKRLATWYGNAYGNKQSKAPNPPGQSGTIHNEQNKGYSTSDFDSEGNYTKQQELGL